MEIFKSLEEFLLTIGIIIFVVGLLFGALMAAHNPKNIIGVVYYKDGNIVYTKVFKTFSDFEEYKKGMYENYSDKIHSIIWIYANSIKDSSEE